MIPRREGAASGVTLIGNQSRDGPCSTAVEYQSVDGFTDNIREIGTTSSAALAGSATLSPPAPVSASAGKSRYRTCLKVLQKINMVFLVLFVCYFVWTVSANYARSYGDETIVTGNITSHINTTHYQVEEKAASDKSPIPFVSASRNSPNDDVTYQTNVVISGHHRKRAKKRRKKGRGKHNRRLRNRHNSSGTTEEFLNLTAKPHRFNRKNDTPCKNCKIKKRKSRNRIEIGLIRASTLRRILEKVADQTMSGARFGDGTFFNREVGNDGGVESGWSNNQKKVHVTLGGTNIDNGNNGRTDGARSDGSVTSWTSWSSCSVTCGAGQRERMRDCGTACREVESMVCIRPACKDVSDDSLSTITEFYKWEKAGFVPPLKPPKQESLDPNVDVCSDWVTCNREIAHEYFSNSTLPACPCFYPLKRENSKVIHDAILDRTFTWDDASSHSDLVYKPEAHSCIRSRPSPGATNLAVQQCCYDVTFTLVTRGKSAGTPNLISAAISKELHYKLDLLPWIICKGDWTRYNKVMPPDNQLRCPSNPDDFTIRQQTEEVKLY